MRSIFCFITVFIFFISCKEQTKFSKNISLEETILYSDSVSIRALSIIGDTLWFAGSKGKYGTIDLVNKKIFRGRIANDTMTYEFRSLGVTDKAFYVLSVSNPALLYRVDRSNRRVDLVYKEENEKVFFDSMQFLDNQFGIAMGDPVSNCLNLIITRDGGKNWQKITCDQLPKVEEGEAAFAASNTNVIIKGHSIFMVTGGKKARCMVSNDQGMTWNTYETPIVQGKQMTGIFTADFYNNLVGVVAGGDYDSQEMNFNNKAMTIDGGKTWRLIGNGTGFGYASCIQFVPNSKGKSMLVVGGTGIHFSKDQGETWTKLSDVRDLYTLRFKNDSIAYAAGKNKIVELKLTGL